MRHILALLFVILGSHACAVVSTPTDQIQYTGNGSVAAYSIPFKFFQNADILVSENASGTITQLALGTNYTLVGAGFPSGGTVTLTAGNLPSGVVLTVLRSPALVQNVSLPNGSPYFGSTIEGGLDLACMQIQAQANYIARSIQYPVGDTATAVLPSATLRANKYLYFDGSGNATTTASVGGVSAINTIVGAITLAAGTNITITPSGNTLTFAAAGGSSAYYGGLSYTALAAVTTNQSISSAASTFDGATPAAGNLLLLTGQTTASQNGIWQFSAAGSPLARPLGYASGAVINAGASGALVSVTAGTVNINSIWTLSSVASITVDTTSTTWTEQGVLPSYTNGTFTGILGGFTGAPPMVACDYTIYGKMIYLHLAAASGTSNSNSLAMANMPSVIAPSVNRFAGAYPALSNNVNVTGSDILIQPNQTIVFGFPGGFMTTGTKGILDVGFTYSL